MTEKYVQKDEAIINTMTDELVTASSEDSAEIIVDWLNRIFEKNGELSKENYGLQDGLDFYREQNAYLSEQLTECLDARKAYKDDWKACVSYCDTYKDEIHTYKDNIEGLKEENEQLKKENKHLRCTIESNSQDDYIDFLEKQNEMLKERIEELASNDKIVFMVNE